MRHNWIGFFFLFASMTHAAGVDPVGPCPKVFQDLQQKLTSKRNTTARPPEPEEIERPASQVTISDFADLAGDFTPREFKYLRGLRLTDGKLLELVWRKFAGQDRSTFHTLLFDETRLPELQQKVMADPETRARLLAVRHPWLD